MPYLFLRTIGMSLGNDIIEEILKRVDGTTLAKAGCTCSDFWSVIREEGLWKDACHSLWPSTATEEVRLLVSSLGGFKKFFADCYPLVNIYKDSTLDSNEDYWYTLDEESDLDQEKRRHNDLSVFPSDFVSILDVQWKNKSLYSNVLHGIPIAGDMIDCRSFLSCPFVINLRCDNSHTISSRSSISNRDEDAQNNELLESMRLSWILINTSTKQAVNLSSWRPLEARKCWASDTDYLFRFGSILPSCSKLPLKLAVCDITLTCRINCGYREGITLGVSEIGMKLEDMMGSEVSTREGIFVLQRCVEWRRRSVDQDQVIKYCHDMFEVQTDLMEKRLEIQGFEAPLSILMCLLVVVASYFLL